MRSFDYIAWFLELQKNYNMKPFKLSEICELLKDIWHGSFLQLLTAPVWLILTISVQHTFSQNLPTLYICLSNQSYIIFSYKISQNPFSQCQIVSNFFRYLETKWQMHLNSLKSTNIPSFVLTKLGIFVLLSIFTHE